MKLYVLVTTEGGYFNDFTVRKTKRAINRLYHKYAAECGVPKDGSGDYDWSESYSTAATFCIDTDKMEAL